MRFLEQLHDERAGKVEGEAGKVEGEAGEVEGEAEEAARTAGDESVRSITSGAEDIVETGGRRDEER